MLLAAGFVYITQSAATTTTTATLAGNNHGGSSNISGNDELYLQHSMTSETEYKLSYTIQR